MKMIDFPIEIRLSKQKSREYKTVSGQTIEYWKFRANAVSKAIMKFESGTFEIQKIDDQILIRLIPENNLAPPT